MANDQGSWPVVAGAISWLVVAVAGLVVFRSLGFGVCGAAVLVLAIVAAGRVDLPLARRAEEAPNRRAKPGVSLNLGGGLIPLGLAVYEAGRLPSSLAGRFLIATAAVAVMSYLLARPVPGRGIVLPWILPALLGAALALILARTHAQSVAFSAGTLGTFVGADLLHLPSLTRIGAVRMGIGGDGPFDGLLWSGLLAAGMAGGF